MAFSEQHGTSLGGVPLIATERNESCQTPDQHESKFVATQRAVWACERGFGNHDLQFSGSGSGFGVWCGGLGLRAEGFGIRGVGEIDGGSGDGISRRCWGL